MNIRDIRDIRDILPDFYAVIDVEIFTYRMIAVGFNAVAAAIYFIQIPERIIL